MSSNPNNVNYIITYDSDINSPTPIYLAPLMSVTFQRNIAPSDDNATITLAGIGYKIGSTQYPIESAREVYIYRQNSDGTTTLKFRGMTTNPTYSVSDSALTTTIEVQSLWYMLSTRLFQIAGKSPPPLQPNTNPYIVYLNPTLGLNFGQIWAYIMVNAFQGSYTTGHLPTLQLANLSDSGVVNPSIPQGVTDFDGVVVNDNMNIQYMSVSAVLDRLVTSALFNSDQGQPFLSEYRLDIGDLLPQTEVFGTSISATSLVLTASSLNSSVDYYVGYILTYTSGPASGQSQTVLLSGGDTVTTAAFSPAPTSGGGDSFQLLLPDTVRAKLPTVSVMLFDPTHSKLGNGNNRTGLPLGDNSLDPLGTAPADLLYPMDYVEFGVTNGYLPIDTIIFAEGDNIVSVDLTYDYESMNNSYVLTGGSFQGSDVVALPINNQRSIAEYGLKQTNQTLNNVVDTGEIQRYVGTSINFFQHPIPNIVVVPDYVYASSHILYPGDYVLLNTPSLAGVVTDSNGNVLEGSYIPPNLLKPGQTNPVAVNAYTARIKTIDITWSPDAGEDITLTFTFPITNVPLVDWNIVGNSTYNGANAGGQQFMYTTVAPAAHTVIGKGRNQEGASLYQSGGDFISNRSNPITKTVEDEVDGGSHLIPDTEFFSIPIYAQTMTNLANVVKTDGTIIKGDSALIYQLGFEVDTVNSSAQNTVNTPNTVYLTILQPDGMAIFDSVIALNQAVNILTLLSQSHSANAVQAQALIGVTPLKTTSATATVLTDTDLSLSPNSFIGYTLTYTSGPAVGQSQIIISNTINTITSGVFSPAPTSGGGDSFNVFTTSSAPLLSDISGLYTIIFRNSIDFGWCPEPLFASLPAPAIDTTNGDALGNTSFYIYCPVDINGNEVGMSYQGLAIDSQANGLGAYLVLSWPAIASAVRYNIYKAVVGLSFTPTDILTNMAYLDYSVTNSYTDYGTFPTQPNTQPFDTQWSAPTGFQCQFNGVPVDTSIFSTYFTSTDYYWYLITANNPENAETGSSQATVVFRGINTTIDGQPDNNQVYEYEVASTTTAGTTATVLEDTAETWTVSALIGYALQYTSGTAMGQYQIITGNTAHSITTAAFSPAPSGSGDTYQVGFTQVELSWPTVPYAQSYNIYRAQATTTTIPVRTDFKQIAGAFANNGAITGTTFIDDGVTFTASSSTPPAFYPVPPPTTNAYTAYMNYSFSPNPAYAALISGFLNNTSTVTTQTPRTPRIFLPARYSVTTVFSHVDVYGSIGAQAKGRATAS